MRKSTTLFFVLALIALSAGTAAAQAPDPMLDLEEEFLGCRPGPCDVIDYVFAVKNHSTTHHYMIEITGSPQVLESGNEVKDCCYDPQTPCENWFTGEEQILLAGGCEAGLVGGYDGKKLPDCEPLDCECDYNGPCNDPEAEPWCVTIDDAMVVVTQWRAVDEQDWNEYTPPIRLCAKEAGGGVQACKVTNFCTGNLEGYCYDHKLCQ